MALYRFEAKIFSREKRGRSVVAAAAYRAGERLKDERYDKVHDYTRRGKGVVETTILTPEGAPKWAHEPGRLWNTVELREKRVDAQLAREFILAVPRELSPDAQFQLALDWARQDLVACGMVAHISLHHPKDGKNPHVHILCTMRKLDGEDFSAKKAVEWNDVAMLVKLRASWADAVNAALEKSGREERVDHRSLKDRGIDRIPEPKIGVAATAMKRRGKLIDPERFQLARYVQTLNAVKPWMKAIAKFGEVHQHGMGKTWWERSLIFVSNTRQAVRDTVMDTWKALTNFRRSPGHEIPPEAKGPDHSR